MKRDPKRIAERILSRFPGFTVHNKASSFLVILSSLAYLVSNEYIIIENETYELLSFSGAVYIWYKILGPTVRNHYETKRANYDEFIESIKQTHIQYFNDRVIEKQRISELPQISNSLHEMAIDMVKMKSEIYKLKQINEFSEAVKTWLNSNVAYEMNMRSALQKSITDRVSTALREALKSTAVKTQILNDSINTLEAIAKSAN